MTHEHKDEIKTIRLSTALWLLGSVLGILVGWYSLKGKIIEQAAASTPALVMSSLGVPEMEALDNRYVMRRELALVLEANKQAHDEIKESLKDISRKLDRNDRMSQRSYSPQ